MKIKQMAEEIRKTMPKDLNELETLRYIYIYLGKHKNFDPKYFFGDTKTKNKIYELTNKNLENEEFLTENRYLICTSISSCLRLLGKEFDIEIECMNEEQGTGAHMYNVARLKDGRIINMDIQQDLSYIHAREQTVYFGTKGFFGTRIDPKTLEQIDEKINYKEKGKPYHGEEILKMIKGMKKAGKLESVRNLLNNEEFNKQLQNGGYVELRAFVKECLIYAGGLTANLITCYRDEDVYKQPLPERQYSMCIFAMDKGKSDIYMFKQKEKRFVEVPVEKMRKLVNQGLNFQKTLHTRGVIIWLNHILKESEEDKEL